MSSVSRKKNFMTHDYFFLEHITGRISCWPNGTKQIFLNIGIIKRRSGFKAYVNHASWWCCGSYSEGSRYVLGFRGPENLKKSRQKNSWNQINQNVFTWNCISGSFKLFLSSKIDFWPFLKLQKMEFGQTKFSWN